jgi:hypothetical protein
VLANWSSSRARSHLVAHLREFWVGPNGIGQRLGLHDKFRKLDLVQRAVAVGQLHTGLHRRVTLAGPGAFPLGTDAVLRLDSEGFAAHTACTGHGRQNGIARHLAVHGQRSHHVDQRVKTGALFARLGFGNGAGCGHGIEQLGISESWLQPLGLLGIGRREGCICLAGGAFSRDPGVVRHDRSEDDTAQHRQAQLKVAHSKISSQQ